jgi:general secretion pathway protein G
MTENDLSLAAERSPRQSGFTLLEILIAIALLAAVAGLLITNLDRILGSGNEEVARIYVNETLETPLMTYRVHMGGYPTTEQGLEALRSKPSEDATNWKGPYVKKLPNDPWGNPYQYRYPGEKNPGSYDVWSLGPDGKESEDDIGNWEKGADGEDGAPGMETTDFGGN